MKGHNACPCLAPKEEVSLLEAKIPVALRCFERHLRLSAIPATDVLRLMCGRGQQGYVLAQAGVHTAGVRGMGGAYDKNAGARLGSDAAYFPPACDLLVIGSRASCQLPVEGATPPPPPTR